MGFVETLLSGFILALVGGMAWFAYTHPKGYDKLYYPLLFTAWVAFISMTTYEIGRSLAYVEAIKAIEDKKTIDAVKMAMEANALPFGYISLGFLAFQVFHLFLGLVLPTLVAADSRKSS